MHFCFFFRIKMLDCLIVAYVTQRDRYEWWNLAQVPLGCLHLEPGYPRGRVVANAGTHDTLGGCGRTSLTGRTLRHVEVGRSLAVHRLPAARGLFWPFYLFYLLGNAFLCNCSLYDG